jgi:F0F1-type ATP synthase assembly protein I
MPSIPPSEGPDETQRDASRDADRRDAEMYTKVVGYLLAGPLLYGGIGWGLDHWLGTSFLLPVGILGGVALSLYLIWFRYGSG